MNRLLLLILVAVALPTAAFVVPPASTMTHPTTTSTTRIHEAVEPEPEPEGGKELMAITSMPGCRMKQMDELQVKSDIGTPYQFWMTAEVDATLIKEIRTQILKDASKKANFPGFRKGQVPPYAQPQITNFAVQEAIIKTAQAAIDAFGVKALEGSDGEMEVKEDVAVMSKLYKTGDSLKFTATVNGAYDPEVARPEEASSDATVMEAKVVEE